MIKIQFFLKRSNDKKKILEYIIIGEPKIDKTIKTTWGSPYICEVYLSDIRHSLLAYSINPIDTLFQAVEIAKCYLQGLVKNGCVISEVENKEPWKLEKLSDNYLQEKISELKNNKNISEEDKQKILGIMKESFGKIPHMKDKFNISFQ